MATARTTSTLVALVVAALAGTALVLPQIRSESRILPAPSAAAAVSPDSRGFSRELVEDVQTLEFSYESHTGEQRLAAIVLPAWYGPENNPALDRKSVVRERV